MWRLLAVLLFPGAALAQAVAFDPEQVQTCLADGNGADCIGVAAMACTVTPDLATDCMVAEFEWWDAELSARFSTLIAAETSVDSSISEIPRFAERPAGGPLVTAMQGHFLALRAASCAYEALEFWSTDGEGFAQAHCLMQMTGDMALRLREWF